MEEWSVYFNTNEITLSQGGSELTKMGAELVRLERPPYPAFIVKCSDEVITKISDLSWVMSIQKYVNRTLKLVPVEK